MANKVYEVPEAKLHFVPATAAQAETEPFECHNLATVTGVRSARFDRGATAARSALYDIRAFCQFQATPAVGDLLSVYLWTSDGTHDDNDDGTPDSSTALSAEDKLGNVKPLGAIRCDEAAADIPQSRSWKVEISSRYFAIVFFNRSAVSLTNDVDENGATVEPLPPEIQ